MADEKRKRKGVDEVLLERHYEMPEGDEVSPARRDGTPAIRQTARAADDSTAVGRFAREISPFRSIPKALRYFGEERTKGAEQIQRGDWLEGLMTSAFAPWTGPRNAFVRDPVLAGTGSLRRAEDAGDAADLLGGGYGLAKSAGRSVARKAAPELVGKGDGFLRTTGRSIGYPTLGYMTASPMTERSLDGDGELFGRISDFDPAPRLPPSAFARERSLWDGETPGFNDGGRAGRIKDGLGFFSRAVESALGLKQNKGTPEQMRAMLLKSGVKPDELKWTGFDEWAKDKKSITKDEAVAFLDQNRVQVGEKTLGHDRAMAEKVAARNSRLESVSKESDDLAAAELAAGRIPNAHPRWKELEKEYYSIVDARFPEPIDPKFQQYTLPGGDNYREVLMTATDPSGVRKGLSLKYDDQIAELTAKRDALAAETKRIYSDPNSDGNDFARAQDYARDAGGELRALTLKRDQELAAALQMERPYRSSHWEDDNVLAHLRMKDRVDPEGRKVLHLEELQSDWAQEGRKRGFRGEPIQYGSRVEGYTPAGYSWDKTTRPDVSYVIHQLKDAQGNVVAEGSDRLDAMKKSGLNPTTPNAPFVDSTQKWTDLALKRALKEAADGGYDALAWTPGAEQAKRYDLSKQISRLYFDDASSGGIGKPDMNAPLGAGTLRAYDHDGKEVISKYVDRPEDVEGLVGKDVAKRLLEQQAAEAREAGMGFRRRALEGENLSVGGEGMIGYYDNIVPKRLKELTKGLDPEAQFGTLDLSNAPRRSTAGPDVDNLYRELADEEPPAMVGGGSWTVPSLTITPAMRAKIKEGLPLFALPGMAGASSLLPPSAFEEPLGDPEEFSKGGKVDRRMYWEKIPSGDWLDPHAQDVYDYRDTELHDRLRPERPPLRRGRGIDPIGEGREEMWQELRGYEHGGEVEDYDTGEEAPVDEETLSDVIAWLAAQGEGDDGDDRKEMWREIRGYAGGGKVEDDDMDETPQGEETYVAQDEADFKEALRLWATTKPFKDHKPEAIKWRLVPAFRNGRLLMLTRDGEVVGFAVWGWMTNREYETRKYSGEDVFTREIGDKIVITDSVINGGVPRFSRQMAEYFREAYPEATHVYAHRRGGREASFAIKKVLGDV